MVYHIFLSKAHIFRNSCLLQVGNTTLQCNLYEKIKWQKNLTWRKKSIYTFYMYFSLSNIIGNIDTVYTGKLAIPER